MFKSTTDIKKKRPCHTNGHSEKVHKKPLKVLLEGDTVGNSRIGRHLPRYQAHISTQTDSIQIKSHEVKGYSGRNEKETVNCNIEKNSNSVYAVKILELQEKIAEKECIKLL